MHSFLLNVLSFLEYFRKFNKFDIVEKPRRIDGTWRNNDVTFFLEKRQKWSWKKWRSKFATIYLIKLRSPILHKKNFNPGRLWICNNFSQEVLNGRNTNSYFTLTVNTVLHQFRGFVFLQSQICSFINIV